MSSSLPSCCILHLLYSMINPQNSGLRAGELFPVVRIGSKSVVVITHASYSAPEFTVTLGKVATYSIIPEPAAGFVVEGDRVVRSEDARSESVSRNLTFDASPLFTVTIATTSPADLSAPNIVIITYFELQS